MSEAPVIELLDPVVLLDDFPALAGGLLSVGRGRLVVVTGHNGSGKSTLLRLLGGLVPLASGYASVLGWDLALDRRRHRPHVGYLGHAIGLYGDLTVRDNLAFFQAVGGSDVAPGELVQAFGLQAFLDVPVSRLSAGQRRRSALAATFGRAPSVLLLDEPHAELDRQGRAALNAHLHAFTRRGGTAVVVSHDPALLEHVDTFVYMANGSINNVS